MLASRSTPKGHMVKAKHELNTNETVSPQICFSRSQGLTICKSLQRVRATSSLYHQLGTLRRRTKTTWRKRHVYYAVVISWILSHKEETFPGRMLTIHASVCLMMGRRPDATPDPACAAAVAAVVPPSPAVAKPTPRWQNSLCSHLSSADSPGLMRG